jgi:hypothetical protein
VTDVLTAYGIPGIALAATGIAIRVLFAQVSASAKAESARADRNEAALRAQTDALVERIVPALTENTKAMTEFMSVARGREAGR